MKAYCNGGRTPPEAGGQGWFVPPGTNETNGATTGGTANANGTNPMYFSLVATATTDEGNNWINMRWGPLSLTDPTNDSATSNGTAPAYLGNYSIQPTSGAVGVGAANVSGVAAPSTDFFNNPRPGTARSGQSAIDIGAVELQNVVTYTASVAPTSLVFGNVPIGTPSNPMSVTVTNTGSGALTGGSFTLGGGTSLPYVRVTTGAFPNNAPNCGTGLAVGASCTIKVQFAPTVSGAASGTLTVTYTGATVTGSQVALSGTGIALTYTASVTPGSLAFGSWATGTTSNVFAVTVSNTGTGALTGGSFTLGGGTPLPYTRVTTGTFPNNAPNCGGTGLAVGASCTIKLQFAPATVGTFSGTLAIAFTNASAVTPSTVTLTGSGVATKATLTITAPTLTIKGSGFGSVTGTVTLSNASANVSDVAVSNVAVSGGGIFSGWAFTAGGGDTCTGAVLAPGASCTFGVRYTALNNTPHSGNITFTDTGLNSPQSAALTGN